MIGRPELSVFAVEDTTAQVVWRHLRPGRLVLAPDGAPPAVLELGEAAAPPGTEASGDAKEPVALAGAVTLGGLAPDAAVRIVASGPAIGGERELHLRTLPALPGDELTRVATISDLHLGATAFGRRKTIVEPPDTPVPHPERCSAAAVDEAAAWGAKALYAKGDLTNGGQVDQWRTFTSLVARSPVSVRALPGNHDRVAKPGTDALSPEDAADVFGLHLAAPILVDDRPGVRAVLVDTTSGRGNHGRLSVLADPVLDAVAGTGPGSMALVLLHHQLHQHATREVWPIGVARAETVAFLDRLASTGVPALVSSGHTHRHRRWAHGAVAVTQVGSTKDYPGVWAGYVVHEGGVRQTVQRVAAPDCIAWTDRTRRAVGGTWRWISPGLLRTRCFTQTW